MATIQVVLDEDLLAATDRLAQEQRTNRSALVREALRAHLERRRILEMEERDRQGYAHHPDTAGDLEGWEQVAEWPEP